MKVTDIKIREVKESSKIRATVNVVFDDEFVVNDIKIIEGNKGYFIAFPSKLRQDDKFISICHPINNNTRQKIQEPILEEYKKTKGDTSFE